MWRSKICADLQFYSQKSEAKQFSGDDELLGAVQISWIIHKRNRINLNWWCILTVLEWLKLFYIYMLPHKNMIKKYKHWSYIFLRPCVPGIRISRGFHFAAMKFSQHGREWAAKGSRFVINRTHLAFWIHVYILEISTTK